MDTLNSVEISKIRVRPLSEWNYLLSRTPPASCAWPERSQLLCWWCCHSFSNVPAYLPVKVTMDMEKRTATFVFTGNFCSWNCVKRYAMVLQDCKKEPEGCFYIGMLAFMTVCKGNPCDGPEMHDLGLCDCIDSYRGVKLPMGREILESFGGSMKIDDYRLGFHRITDYEKIRRHFVELTEMLEVKRKAMASPHVKFWGFKYLHYAGPDTSCTTHVNILPLTNRTFNKKNLVLTGNEAQDRATKLGNDDEAPTGRTRGRPPTQQQRGAQPRAQRLTRRKANANPPVALSSLTDPSSTATRPQENSPPRRSNRIMTTEQVLACNEEQQFYTNSLRGYGNILTSMGIKISKPT